MLARIRKAMDEKEEGFTLIELLVVIIIIGILAAIAIPVFLNQRKKGYDAQTKSDVRNAITIFETYATDYNGAYPYTALSAAAGTDLTATATTTAFGTNIGKSTNDTSLVGAVSANSTTATYQIAGLSNSGNEYCYNSSKASAGVVKVTTPTSSTVATASDC